jgi:hypothetical protein
MNRFSITPDKLSDMNLVSGWFKDKCWNLYEIGNSDEEMVYLKAIQEVATRTGAPNIHLADYILRLEERLNLIESYVFANP